MHIHNKLLFVVVFVLATAGFYAQDPARDRIKPLKVAFITEQLRLTPEEAESFWPIYNQHEETLRMFRKRVHTEFKVQSKVLENMSSKDASALLDELLALQKERYEAEQRFIKKMSKVIQPQKTLLLLEAERAFKKQLLLQYRKRRGSE